MTRPLQCSPEAKARATVADADHYISLRLIDALLREDVQGLVSQSRVRPWTDAPPGQASSAADPEAFWLHQRRRGGLALWLAVQPSPFMQRWRSLDALAAVQDPLQGTFTWLQDYESLLAFLAQDLAGDDARLYRVYIEECRVAVRHHRVCDAARRRWFAALNTDARPWPRYADWSENFLFFDRLAAFLDHPFYPTARAKLGLSETELETFGPEFQAPFELRWLAVPKAVFQGELDQWPAFWPSFERLGLAPELGRSHVLMPVHPSLWHGSLEALLAETNLADQVIPAPSAALRVRPTLSVRTLAIEAAPLTHIKLPLAMRTLGSKNIRTVKPSTIGDGHRVQTLLGDIAGVEPDLRGRLCLTDESRGGHAGGRNFLGFILRRYPSELEPATLVSVAGLLAEGADGRTSCEVLAQRFYDNQVQALFEEYTRLTLAVHLRLWLGYGIALESNQQNSMLALEPGKPLRLLLKDNDAPRIWLQRLAHSRPELARAADQLEDRRILVDDELALAQMFVTITLQLNLAVPLEGLIALGLVERTAGYRLLRHELERQLDRLASEGLETDYARQVLLQAPTLHAKYLLRAGSLESKSRTGAADINKFYGQSAPNFLREDYA